MFVVEDMSRIRVQVNVPQSHAASVHVGTDATIALPESSSAPVTGNVTRIPDSVDANSRTMLAEIELDNSVYKLQPGSYSRVTLDVPQTGNAWTIPTNTLNMRVDGPHVVVVDDANRTALRRVTLGRDLGKRVIVTDGIQGNERLVVNPDEGVAKGVEVQVDDANSNGLAAAR
jgi:RND family efflux transporter MFP subunit